MLPINHLFTSSSSTSKKSALPPISQAELARAEDVEKFLSGPPSFKHDETSLHSFISLHGGPFINGSKYEGGNAANAFDYWGSILKLKESVISHGLTPKQLESVMASHQDLVDFEGLMTPQASANTIYDTIKERCNKKGVCYLPARWHNIDGGHFFVLKVKLGKSNSLVFSFLDYGAGSIYHGIPLQGGTKTKNNLSSDAFVLSRQESIDFISTVIQIKHDRKPFSKFERPVAPDIKLPSNLSTVQQTNAGDFYGALDGYSSSVSAASTQHGVTSQRSGTCWLHNTRAVTVDTLVGCVSPVTLKRCQFVWKIDSIAEMYKAMRSGQVNNANGQLVKFVKVATHELTVRCSKGYPEYLSSQELALALAIAKAVDKQCAALEDESLTRACEPFTMPSLVGKGIVEPAITIEEITEEEQKVHAAEEELKESESHAFPISSETSIPPLEPENVTEYLKDNVVKLLQKRNNVVLSDWMRMHHFLCTLFDTYEKVPNFWELLPQEQIGTIFEELNRLFLRIAKNDFQADNELRPSFGTYDDFREGYKFEVLIIAYDILSTLAPRHPHLKLGNEYAFEFSNMYSNQSFFLEAPSYQRINAIKERFRQRCQGKKAIFGNIIHVDGATQEYVMKQLVSNQDKILWLVTQKMDVNLSDLNFFSSVMINGDLANFINLAHKHTAKSLIRISQYIHSFGSKQGFVYESAEVQGRRFFYMFQSDEVRALAFGYDEHFPKRANPQDFLENTAFYPEKALKEMKRDDKKIEFFNFSYKFFGTSRQLVQSGMYLEEDSFPTPVTEEESRVIETSNHFQIHRTLEWITRNFELMNEETESLSDDEISLLEQFSKHRDIDGTPKNKGTSSAKGVRNRIFQLLFEYGKLAEALSYSSKEVLKLLSEFQAKTFAHALKTKNVQSILWLCSLSHYLQDFVTQLSITLKIDISTMQWFDTRGLLKSLYAETTDLSTKGLIALHIVHSFLPVKEFKDPQEALTLLRYAGIMRQYSNFQMIVGNDKRSAFPIERKEHYTAERVLIMHEPAMRKALAGANLKTFAEETLFFSQGIRVDRQWVVRNDELADTQNEFVINLTTGLVTKVARSAEQIQDHLLRDNPQLQSIIQLIPAYEAMQLTEVLSDCVAKSADGEWEIFLNGPEKKTYNKYVIKSIIRTVVLNGAKKKFLQATKQISKTHTQWESLDKDKWILELANQPEQEQSFIYRPNIGKQQLAFSREQKSWVTTNIGYIDVQSPNDDFERQWAEIFRTFNAHAEIETEQVGNQRTVKKVTFPSLQLTFNAVKTRAGFILEAVEYPGYQLVLNKSIRELHGLTGALILRNEGGDQQVLLPALKFKGKKRSRALNSNIKFDPSSHISETRYFRYKIHEGKLVANESTVDSRVAADLYLAGIYAAQEKYQLAFDALDRTHFCGNNNKQMWEIANMFRQRPNRSPLGALFCCHVAYRMHLHEKHWTKDRPHQSRLVPIKVKVGVMANFEEHLFVDFVKGQFSYYLRNLSTYKEGINAMPVKWRLTQEQTDTLHTILEVGREHRTIRAIENYTTNLATYPSEYISTDVTWPDESEVKERDARPRPFSKLCYDGEDAGLNAAFANKKAGEEIEPIETPGIHYLKVHFLSLFQDAIATRDTYRRHRFLADIHFILNNDSTKWLRERPLIKAILFAYEHPSKCQHLKDVASAKECYEALIKLASGFKPQQQPTVASSHTKPIHPKQNRSLEPQPAVFDFEPINPWSLSEQPLGGFAAKYFNTDRRPAMQRDFVLQEGEIRDPSLMEKRLLSNYTKVDPEAKPPIVEVHTLKDLSVSDLKRELVGFEHNNKHIDGTIDTEQRKLDQLKVEILALARAQAPNELSRALLQQTQQMAGQKQVIDLDTVIDSFLRKDPTLLTSRNCFLNQALLNRIYSKAAELCLVKSKIDQIKDAVRVIDELLVTAAQGKSDPYNVNLLGEILSKRRKYDIKKYPAFLVYEYRSKNMLRVAQVEFLEWAIPLLIGGPKELTLENYRHLLRQFAAAGGKSSVVIPIIAFHLVMAGFIPTIENTPELHNIAVTDSVQILRDIFKIQSAVLEIRLHDRKTAEEYAELLQDMQGWQRSQMALFLEPETLEAMLSAKKKAYCEVEKTLLESIQKVLDFTKIYCVKLEDETHIISNPLQQTKRALPKGQIKKIPQKHKQLFFTFFDYLFGRNEAIAKITSLAGMRDLNRRVVNPTERKMVQQALADEIVKEALFVDISQDRLKQYLLQPNGKRPPWLIDLRVNPGTRDLANLVVLARAFIKTLLPYLEKRQLGKNCGRSIHPKDWTAAPMRKGKASGSYYADPYIRMAVTTLIAEQDGVQAEGLKEMLNVLKQQHLAQLSWATEGSPTLAEIMFKSLLTGVPDFQHLSLNHISAQEIEMLSHHERFRRHPKVIRRFNDGDAIPQIEMPPMSVSVSPAEVLGMFSRSLSVSATTGPREVHPVAINHVRFEPEFDRGIVEILNAKENSRACLIKSADVNLDAVLQQLYKEFPELSGLFDSGSLFCSSTPEEVAKKYLEFADKNRSTLFFEGKEMVLESNDPRIQSLRMSGSKIIEELHKKGLKHEQLILFLFLELARTFGTDVPLHPQAVVGATFDKEQTLDDYGQTIYRARKISIKHAQTMIWVLLETLYKEINPESARFDPKALCYWMLRNMAEQLKTKVVVRAFQGIDQIIGDFVWRTQKRCLDEVSSFEPYDIYELDFENSAPADALKGYIKDVLDKNKCKWSALSAHERALLNTIIVQTSALIETMPIPKSAELNAEVYQERTVEQNQQQQQQQQMQSYSAMGVDAKFTFAYEEYVPHGDGLTTPGFLSAEFLKKSNYLFYNFDTELKIAQDRLPRLIVHHTNLSPLQGFSSLQLTKPIKAFLVQILPPSSREPYRFLACTSRSADFYWEEINRLEQRKKADQPLPQGAVQAKYALVGFNNFVHRASSDVTEADLKELGPYLEPMTTYAAFLNGQIDNPFILARLIKEYGWTQDEYESIAATVVKRHVSREKIELLDHAVLATLCGWNGASVPIGLLEGRQVKFCKPGEVEFISVPIKPDIQPAFKRFSAPPIQSRQPPQAVRRPAQPAPAVRRMPRPAQPPPVARRMPQRTWCQILLSPFRWLARKLFCCFPCCR